ncbi:MAG: HAD family hydrolase [Chlamydiales bacterium]|nr:HAD family hydrolase [Chlamydiales bacterium]
MQIDAIFFDVNGTLIDILTDEGIIDIYRKIRNFLSYQGIFIEKEELKDLYFQILKKQKADSGIKFAEFDAVKIWKEIVELKQTEHTKSLPQEFLKHLPLVMAHLFRGASMVRKLQLYEDVRETLDQLKGKYPLAIVSNAQTYYAKAELRTVGLIDYFDPIIISGDYGYCKPDPRLFQQALDKLKLNPQNVIHVGNDTGHDVFGCKQLGMKSVLFVSNQGRHRFSGADPDYVIKQFRELIPAIEFLKNR